MPPPRPVQLTPVQVGPIPADLLQERAIAEGGAAVRIGRFCLDCWLGDCEQVRLAYITPVSIVDCPCCRRAHDWTDELAGPLVAPVPSSG